MKPTIIYIEVSGQTASGKSGVMELIRSALSADGYSVASPDLDSEARLCSNPTYPNRQRTVIVLSEENIPRQRGELPQQQRQPSGETEGL